MKRVSRVAFGQEYRLPVLLAIGRSDTSTVTQAEIALALGLPSSSSIQNAFRDVVKLGYLVPRFEEGQRKRFYSRSPGVVWKFAEELAKAADEAT